jgi:hypothetical protein
MPGGSSPACARGVSVVEFFLARGSCLNNWDVLLLLRNHGWCVPMFHSNIPSV